MYQGRLDKASKIVESTKKYNFSSLLPMFEGPHRLLRAIISHFVIFSIHIEELQFDSPNCFAVSRAIRDMHEFKNTVLDLGEKISRQVI